MDSNLERLLTCLAGLVLMSVCGFLCWHLGYDAGVDDAREYFGTLYGWPE